LPTSSKELDALAREVAEKNRLIKEENHKVEVLQAAIENDAIKAAVLKELDDLNGKLVKAKSRVAALEKASGVTADSLMNPPTPFLQPSSKSEPTLTVNVKRGEK